MISQFGRKGWTLQEHLSECSEKKGATWGSPHYTHTSKCHRYSRTLNSNVLLHCDSISSFCSCSHRMFYIYHTHKSFSKKRESPLFSEYQVTLLQFKVRMLNWRVVLGLRAGIFLAGERPGAGLLRTGSVLFWEKHWLNHLFSNLTSSYPKKVLFSSLCLLPTGKQFHCVKGKAEC